MDFDNRISFLAGFIFTAATSISIMGFVQAAFLGLIGGFFGLLGKEAFYYTKKEIPFIKSWWKSKIDCIKKYINDGSKNK